MIFGRKKKDETSLKELRYLHGKKLSYAVERKNGEELVLGRNGGISVSEDEVIILCDGHQVFRCAVKGCVAAELMSHNGVDIKGVDLQTGEKRHVVAYYSNFRH